MKTSITLSRSDIQLAIAAYVADEKKVIIVNPGDIKFHIIQSVRDEFVSEIEAFYP